MSCFGGRMKEYERISLDRFDGKNLQSTVYFLSHLHEDHTGGLALPTFCKRLTSNKNIFLYCSEVTKVLICASKKYQHLSPYIKAIPINSPTIIEVPDPLFDERETVTVTLLPAFHCPGSVMVFLEGHEGNVIYTGDFRWEHFDIEQMHHLRSGEGVKQIQSLYVDSTFCSPENLYIPSRQQCINAVYHLVHDWIAQGPDYAVYIYLRAQYGHEPLINSLAVRLNKKIHVNAHKAAVYDNIEEFHNNFTSDGCSTQIHACSKQCTVEIDGERVPCRQQYSEEKVLCVLPTTMYFTQFQHLALDKVVRRISDNFYRACYSFHSSYIEVKDLLSYLKPKHVYPNVKPPTDETLAVTQHRLNMMLQECLEAEAGISQDEPVVKLGALKTKSKGKVGKRKQTFSLSDSESLDFGSPGKMAKHKEDVSTVTRRSSRRLSASQEPVEPQETTPKKRKGGRKKSSSPDLFLTPMKTEKSDVSVHSSYAGSHLGEEIDLTQDTDTQSSQSLQLSKEDTVDSSWIVGSFLSAVNSSSLEDSSCVVVEEDKEQTDEDFNDFLFFGEEVETQNVNVETVAQTKNYSTPDSDISVGINDEIDGDETVQANVKANMPKWKRGRPSVGKRKTPNKSMTKKKLLLHDGEQNKELKESTSGEGSEVILAADPNDTKDLKCKKEAENKFDYTTDSHTNSAIEDKSKNSEALAALVMESPNPMVENMIQEKEAGKEVGEIAETHIVMNDEINPSNAGSNVNQDLCQEWSSLSALDDKSVTENTNEERSECDSPMSFIVLDELEEHHESMTEEEGANIHSDQVDVSNCDINDSENIYFVDNASSASNVDLISLPYTHCQKRLDQDVQDKTSKNLDQPGNDNNVGLKKELECNKTVIENDLICPIVIDDGEEDSESNLTYIKGDEPTEKPKSFEKSSNHKVVVKKIKFSRSRSFDMLDEAEDLSEFGFVNEVKEEDLPDPSFYIDKLAHCFESPIKSTDIKTSKDVTRDKEHKVECATLPTEETVIDLTEDDNMIGNNTDSRDLKVSANVNFKDKDGKKLMTISFSKSKERIVTLKPKTEKENPSPNTDSEEQNNQILGNESEDQLDMDNKTTKCSIRKVDEAIKERISENNEKEDVSDNPCTKESECDIVLNSNTSNLPVIDEGNTINTESHKDRSTAPKFDERNEETGIIKDDSSLQESAINVDIESGVNESKHVNEENIEDISIQLDNRTQVTQEHLTKPSTDAIDKVNDGDTTKEETGFTKCTSGEIGEKELEEREEIKRQAFGFMIETDSDEDSDSTKGPGSPTGSVLYDEYIELSSGSEEEAASKTETDKKTEQTNDIDVADDTREDSEDEIVTSGSPDIRKRQEKSRKERETGWLGKKQKENRKDREGGWLSTNRGKKNFRKREEMSSSDEDLDFHGRRSYPYKHRAIRKRHEKDKEIETYKINTNVPERYKKNINVPSQTSNYYAPHTSTNPHSSTMAPFGTSGQQYWPPYYGSQTPDLTSYPVPPPFNGPVMPPFMPNPHSFPPPMPMQPTFNMPTFPVIPPPTGYPLPNQLTSFPPPTSVPPTSLTCNSSFDSKAMDTGSKKSASSRSSSVRFKSNAMNSENYTLASTTSASRRYSGISINNPTTQILSTPVNAVQSAGTALASSTTAFNADISALKSKIFEVTGLQNILNSTQTSGMSQQQQAYQEQQQVYQQQPVVSQQTSTVQTKEDLPTLLKTLGQIEKLLESTKATEAQSQAAEKGDEESRYRRQESWYDDRGRLFDDRDRRESDRGYRREVDDSSRDRFDDFQPKDRLDRYYDRRTHGKLASYNEDDYDDLPPPHPSDPYYDEWMEFYRNRRYLKDNQYERDDYRIDDRYDYKYSDQSRPYKYSDQSRPAHSDEYRVPPAYRGRPPTPDVAHPARGHTLYDPRPNRGRGQPPSNTIGHSSRGQPPSNSRPFRGRGQMPPNAAMSHRGHGQAPYRGRGHPTPMGRQY